jgi:hypothetical protein
MRAMFFRANDAAVEYRFPGQVEHRSADQAEPAERPDRFGLVRQLQGAFDAGDGDDDPRDQGKCA